jgi:DNA-damage-inducible protein J
MAWAGIPTAAGREDAGSKVSAVPGAERSSAAIAIGLQCSSEVYAMPGNSVVRARIDEKVKVRAAAVLETMGLTLSDAFRLLLVKVAAEQKLPFEIHSPNAEHFDSAEELFKDLDI